jgi:alanyl-tRNA synthetase
MTSDEIRRTFISFFEGRDHKRLPSGSLIPAGDDPSALFTVAGMHPLKPYFLGSERPPHPRVTTCQKTFRTADIDIIGTTTRHLTFFEMLGNFSFGDYFKREAARFAWELSVDGFGFEPQDIWITVFGGDEALGIGADEEAIEAWLEVGVPRERIVECPRSENFWELGPPGPCGPCSELYLDRGLAFGKPEDLPGGDNERFMEYWNLVFMQMNQDPANVLAPLPAKNIDTGLGLNRLAAVLQGKETVFETDQFAPLISLGEELSGRRYGSEFPSDRALRVLADHSRAMTFLIADGVVPSNDGRGYVLRRVMRRAILQGRQTLGLDPGFLERYSDTVSELMGDEYPELRLQRDSIHMWLASEEENFGHTLDQGLKRLDELIARAVSDGDEGISAQDAFLLHDTYGFPFDLTRELIAEHGLGVSEEGFELLMEDQRSRARAAARGGGGGGAVREHAVALAGQAGFATEFLGYETTELETTVGAMESERAGENGRLLVKLVESPFYATGGGQIADAGYVECLAGDCLARVEDVLRLGDDQIVALVPERGSLEVGERVRAHVDRAARRATECNHTATHLLHAALRQRLGPHVRQAGSYVGPDKLRFDFTHSSALAAEDLEAVQDAVNRWILEDHPVHALTTTLDEAKRLGAMALFGEKYGDVVRMVEVGDGSFSRELCGGTHVRSTATIGVFKITAETSSAANVRRIEAITGPAAVRLMRERDAELTRAATVLRVTPEQVAEVAEQLRQRARELERAQKETPTSLDGITDKLLGEQFRIAPFDVIIDKVPAISGDQLVQIVDKVKNRVQIVVLGAVEDGRVHLVAAAAPEAVERGVRAGDLVKAAAAVVGGGGGGRDTFARAGGRDPERLDDAIAVARRAIEAALTA